MLKRTIFTSFISLICLTSSVLIQKPAYCQSSASLLPSSTSSLSSKLTEPQLQLSEKESLATEIFSFNSSKQANSTYQSSSVSSISVFEEIVYASRSSDSESDPSLGVLDLEEHIASSRYSEKPEMIERGILVRAYERILLATCFPPIASVVKGIKLTNIPKRCQNTLEKLAQLHSNNTIAICAKQGVESVDCASSFETQSVRKYQYSEYEKFNLTGQSQGILNSPELKAKFSELQQKLLKTIENFRSEKSIANLKAVNSALYPVLNLICSDDGLELTVNPANNSELLNSPTNRNSLADAIAELERENQNLNSTPTPSSKEIETNVYYRTRILSDSCFDTIADVLNIDSRLSSAICYRDGFISPGCITSIKRMQMLNDPSTITPASSTPKQKNKKDKDGLATF